MMRFLHLADIHLDTPFAGREERVRRRLRDAVRDAFRAAVDLALAERVDAVVIAGDLFDGETLSFASERFIVSQVRRLVDARVAVVYATGNHDPGSDPGRRGAIDWPEGVHVAAGPEPLRVQIHDRTGRLCGFVTAVGHATSREAGDLSTRFPRPAGMLPEVAVLHAQVASSHDSESHGRYAPTTIEALRRRGYDYWALGHVHRRQELLAEPAIHYPGNIQGRTPAEAGARGGLLVEVEAGRPPRAVFRSLGPVRWETIEISGMEEVASFDALVKFVTERWRERLDDEPGVRAEWMVRARLGGGTPLWRLLAESEERETLEVELTSELGALDVAIDADGVHAPIDPEVHRGRKDALGHALRLVAAVRRGEAPIERFENGLQGWDPHESSLTEYVESVLDGADADLASRMLRAEE